MKVVLSREWRKTAVFAFLYPTVLIVLKGILLGWQGMLGLILCALTYFFIMAYCPANLYSQIFIGENAILSRIHFFKQCEVDCFRPVQYLFFSENIKGVSKDEKHYVLITNLNSIFPIKRPYLDHFKRKEQIVIPYTKKTEQVLEKWFSCENWTCIGGMKPDLNAPPSPPPPPPPPPPTRPSEEAADEYNKGFRSY